MKVNIVLGWFLSAKNVKVRAGQLTRWSGGK